LLRSEEFNGTEAFFQKLQIKQPIKRFHFREKKSSGLGFVASFCDLAMEP
jgi:hypothetical protein